MMHTITSAKIILEMEGQCLAQTQKHFSAVMQYSGRYLFQQGQYMECIQNSLSLSYNYITLYDPTSSTWVGATIGLCLPHQCKESYIKSSMDLLFSQMNQPFRVYEINTQIQEYSYAKDFLFFFTIVLLLLLALLSIVSTVLYFRTEKNGQRTAFTVFSLHHAKQMFSYKKSKLNVLNGVKALAMMWVVFGHEYVFGLVHSMNVLTYEPILLKPFFLLVQGGLIAVDTFFFVGGFLVVYSIVKNIKQNSKIGTYLMAIVNRALRFWPSYIVVILIYYSLYVHSGSGPQWPNQAISVGYCENMWKPLLFVDNLVDNGETMCISWGWYLQNDMQIFVVSVIILYWYQQKSKIQAKITIFMLIMASSAYNFYQAQENQYHVNTHMKDFSNWNQYFVDVYIKPWARCVPYLYGVWFGLAYIENLKDNTKHKDNSGHNQISSDFNLGKKAINRYHLQQVFGLALSGFVLFIPYTLQQGYQWAQILHSLYLSVAKLLFVLGLSLALYPSLTGHQSLITTLLDTRLFNFLAKISFWIYLCHLLFIFQFDGSLKYDSYYNVVNLYTLFCGHLVISVPTALVFPLLVEGPFARLQKMLFAKLHTNKSSRTVDDYQKMGGEGNIMKTIAEKVKT